MPKILTRKRGRELNFTFGVPVPKRPIVVHDSQFERAVALAKNGVTAAAILRSAINIGLMQLESQRLEMKNLPENPEDW